MIIYFMYCTCISDTWQATGQELKELIGQESVTFYVSPFLRSRQTYEQLRMSFHDEQVAKNILCVNCDTLHSLSQVMYYREDPRLREQEWGNYQDPEKMEKIQQQRKETGAFYFRFPTGERYCCAI